MKRTRTSKARGDYRRLSPFRSPARRWEAAVERADAGRRRPRWEDPAIDVAVRYLRTSRGACTAVERAEVRRRWPDLSAAHAINANGGVVAHEIEARLLAREPVTVIAAKVGTGAAVVEAFERFFFNVADAAGATDWLLTRAVGVWPGMGRAVTERDVWRYLGLAGGPLVVDLLVADYQDRAGPDRPDRHLLAERGRYLVRELATGWSCRAAAAAVIAEGRALFGHCLGGGGGSGLLGNQLKFLRLAYGLPPNERRRRRQPSSGPRGRREGKQQGDSDANTAGRGIARHDKEFAHGRR